MRPLPPAEWDPSLQYIVDAMGGRPIEIHCLLANHPALLRAWWDYRMHAVGGGDLTQRDCELIILRVAVKTKTWYEWAAHVVRGLAAGLGMDEITRVASGPDDHDWDKKDQALLQCVDQLVADRCISDATQAKLECHFTPQQVMDVIAIQGMYLTIACLIGTWSIEIENETAERLPDGVTEESFAALASATNGH